MFKKFLWFISYYKSKFMMIIIFLILSNLVGLVPPYITGVLTDMIFEGSVALNTFLLILGLDLFFIGIKYIFAMIWSYYTFRAGGEIEYKARDSLMDKFLKQSLMFFEKNSTGSLMGKSTNDVDSINKLASFGTLSFFDSTIFPVIIIITMMVVVDVKLTLVSIIPLPLLAYLSIWIGKRIITRWSSVQRAFDKLNTNVLEDVEGIRIIRVFNLEKQRKEKFRESGQKLLEKNMEVVKYEALLTPVQRIIPAFTFIIGIAYGAVLVSRGEISIGRLISFTYYLNMLVWPMHAFGNFINLKQQGTASMDRIQEVLDYGEDIVERDGAVTVSENFDIAFKNHSFKYPSSNEYSLKDINLEIEKGSSIGVIGRTGSGKSTLLKQLLHLYPMNTETITLDGDSFDKYSIASIRDRIGYVPQKQMIFSKTIRDNVRFAKPDASDEEVMEAIRLADFEKDLELFENGLDTLCGERGVSLSGGQKQRISIARAFLKNPDILILDDPMSAVDGRTEKNILNNIKKNRDKKTMIVSAHRISQVQDLDEIIVMECGRIVESGSHDQLMKNKKWYFKQYENQSARSMLDGE